MVKGRTALVTLDLRPLLNGMMNADTIPNYGDAYTIHWETLGIYSTTCCKQSSPATKSRKSKQWASSVCLMVKKPLTIPVLPHALKKRLFIPGRSGLISCIAR